MSRVGPKQDLDRIRQAREDTASTETAETFTCPIEGL